MALLKPFIRDMAILLLINRKSKNSFKYSIRKEISLAFRTR